MKDEKGNEMEQIILHPIEDEMKTSFIDYSMSVIMSRALPDVRDGLKPVHRRILYAMNEMGLIHNKPHKKSARVVGEVLGKYHPHGDQAIYDALVRMAQNFSLRYPLIDGQGNFGSIDGDSAAAMRYTETRMATIAKEMLQDIDKNTVEWMENFDGSLKEPVILPTKLPNLLINGSSGIAVGMATNMPPHNLGEVIDAIIATINNPAITTLELMESIKGPDFPTGGISYGKGGIASAYSTGRGIIKVRARTHIEEKKERNNIIVTELPYQVNKSTLLENIADLVKKKKIEGIADLRDESDRKGMRIVIQLKRDAIDEIVLNQLFNHTQLESTFGIINLAIVENQPRVLTLNEMIQYYIDHRIDIVTRRSRYELDKAREREHILEGLMIASRSIDEVIVTIRKSEDVKEAKNELIKRFSFSEKQATAILEMRLQRLTAMEIDKMEKELEEKKKVIEKLKKILGSREEILEVIKEELLEIKKYGDERRTSIKEEEVEVEIEDMIPEEEAMITITNNGYIKRISLQTYRVQHRGGKGLIGMETKEGDFIVNSFVTSTHDYILFFTNHGRLYWLKCYRIPESGRHARGKAIVNLLPKLRKGEEISAAIPIHEFDEERYLIFATKNGIIKKTRLSAYGNIRATGVRAISLDENDELIGVELSGKEVILATRNGLACRFGEKEVRATGRVTRGVIGIRLNEGDEVASMIVSEGKDLLTVTENGYGKLTPIEEYRKTHRGGKGVKTIITNERNGKVVSIKEIEGNEEILLASKEGMIVRIPASDMRIQGRNTMGVRLMRLNEGDVVIDVVKV